ncbi:MAG: flagellar protein FlaG [Campylobacterales bacterium]|nr:flagellar protein FlaG [Campylobacterales bacterium]
MEIFNSTAKQQNMQIQAEQVTVSKQQSVQEVKPQTELKEQKAEAQKPATTETEARELIDSLNKALNPFNTSLRFGFDNSSDVFYVSVIDTNTSDTIRRFPLEQASALTAKMNEVIGIIFDEKG